MRLPESDLWKKRARLNRRRALIQPGSLLPGGTFSDISLWHQHISFIRTSVEEQPLGLLCES